MAGLMRYNYDGIGNAVTSIDNFIAKMDSIMDDIEAALKPLEGEAWNGMAAQEAYLARKTQWRNAALQIAQSLVSLKIKLNDGAEGIRSTDLRSAQMFGG